MSQPAALTPIQLDRPFLQQLRIGDRLFHYPAKGSTETSFTKSPSAEFTLYSVIELPTEEDVVLVRAFDTKEEPRSFSRSELLSGDWWYTPKTD